jgi:hypothetical protein
MSAIIANGVTRSETSQGMLARPAPGVIAALFCGYLAVAYRFQSFPCSSTTISVLTI